MGKRKYIEEEITFMGHGPPLVLIKTDQQLVGRIRHRAPSQDQIDINLGKVDQALKIQGIYFGSIVADTLKKEVLRTTYNSPPETRISITRNTRENCPQIRISLP